MQVYGQLKVAQIENLTVDPTGTGLVPGRMWYRTDSKLYKVYDGAAVQTFVDLNTAQTLQNKIFDTITWQQLGATPANPPAGFNKTYFKTDGKQYTLDSSGIEQEVGSGGSGNGINYISTPGGESGTPGWVGYADAAGVTPVDGTGGVSGIVFTSTTVSPLRNTSSFLWTKDAANRQGHGESYDFTIDEADRFKVLQGSIEYAIASGTYADNDLAIYIYDVTNSQLIQPAPFQIKNHSLPAERLGFEFQATGSTSYRLIIHTASTSALAYSLKFDSFSVGPQAKLYGSPVTDIVDESTLFTIGGDSTFGAVTYSARSVQTKKIGDVLRVNASFTSSGAGGASGNLILRLPSKYQIDPAKSIMLGTGEHFRVGSSLYSLATRATRLSATDILLNLRNDAGGSSAVDFNSGSLFGFNLDIPIVGWSSSVIMSDSASTRVIVARAALTTAQTGITSKVIPFNVISRDDVGGFSSGVYTVRVPGAYRVSAGALLANLDGATNSRLQIRKNGNAVADAYMARLASGSATDASGYVNDLVTCVAGDTIDIFVIGDASFDIDNNGLRTWVAINLESGPAQIAASEKIYAEYRTSAGQSIPNATNTIVNYGTKTHDSHNLVTVGASWKFTSGISGLYRVVVKNLFLTGQSWAAGTIAQASIFKNNSATPEVAAYKTIEVGHSQELMVTGEARIKLLAGDFIDVRLFQNAGAARSLYTGADFNVIFIERIGEY